MKEWWILIPISIYLTAVIGSLYGARKLRPTRWPFKAEDRLLRGPGESLRKEVAQIDESMIFELAGGTIVALLVLPVSAWVAKFLGFGTKQVIFTATVWFLVATLLSTRRIFALWKKRQNYYLGWFGERVVAEKLAPLRFSGWRVFHDVPFVSNGKTFNIDHVVVGEGGLFVIETKTRRKGGNRGPEPDDVVHFDGHALHWPRCKDDTGGLDQAETNAKTLTKWLAEEIGENVPASPILVIPGWTLKFTGTGPRRTCRVDSANWIQNTFKDLKPILSPKTADLITRRLLAKCRDVEN
ncbi:MAG: nuclease-related domain-containing protein [Verrucomicrobiota bacterium]